MHLRTVIGIPLLALLLTGAPLLGAQPSAQTVVTKPAGAADLCTLLGPAVTNPLTGAAVGRSMSSLWICTWDKPNSPDILAVEITTPKNPNAQLDLMRSLTASVQGAIVKDETGIGAHAFSVVYPQKPPFQSFGAEIQFVTATRHVFIKFSSGTAGTEQMRDALRVIAKKLASAAL